jgi:hypothetical protein
MNYLTTSRAANIAGVNEETIRRWCEHCGLEHERIKEMYAITEDNLRWFLEHGDRSGYGGKVNPPNGTVRKRAKEMQRKMILRRNRQRLDEIVKLRKRPIRLERGER